MEEDRERARRAREAEARRAARKRKRERAAASERRAAEAEYQEWEDRQNEIAAIAASTHSMREVEKRLKSELEPRVYEPPVFEESPPFDFANPKGPSASLVDRIRKSAEKKAAEEKVSVLYGLGYLGWVVAVLLAFHNLFDLRLVSGFFAGWSAVGILAGGGFVLAILSGSVAGAEQKAILSAAAEEASARYVEAEAQRKVDFDRDEADQRQEFEALQARRIANARDALSTEPAALHRALDATIADTLETIPISCSVTATVRSSSIVDVAFLAPDPDKDLPTQKASLIGGGQSVSYRDRPARELADQYWRVVHGLTLRFATEVYSRMPSIETVRVDAFEERIDEATGATYLACILAFGVSRSSLLAVKDWQKVEPDTVVAEHGGRVKWKSGEFVERPQFSRLGVKRTSHFERLSADWPSTDSEPVSLDVSGTWMTEYVYRGSPTTIAMELVQSGSTVSGSSGKTKLVGEMSGRELVANWKEGRATGPLRFEFSEDGRRFDGTWSTDGSPDRGAWNGKRSP